MKARTKDELIEMILKHTKRAEFIKEYNNGVLKAIKRNGLTELYEKQMPMQLNKVGHWTNENVLKLAKTYSNRALFRKENQGAYSAMFKRGDIKLLDSVLPSQKKEWTKELVMKEVKKYKMSKHFIKNANGAYNHAMKNNYYNEIQNTFEQGNTSWSYDSLKKEALKHKTISDFRKSSSAYDTIIARGLLNELCNHLEYSGKGGFDGTKSATLYYLRVCGGTAYKIGITNRSVEDRFKLSDLENIEVLKTWNYPIGYDAADMETRILSDYKYAKYSGVDLLNDGNSELFNVDILGLD